MNSRETIKSLMALENITLTKIAEAMTKRTGKHYTLKSLSQKLSRASLRAEEFKTILDILGYEIKIIKK